MTGPWVALKKSWYHRQAKRALWFLRYMDRMAYMSGWSRAQIRTMWLDFVKHPSYRMQTLDRLAVINKVTIKRERITMQEEALVKAYATIERLSSENASLRKSLVTANCGEGSDKKPTTEGAKNEVHQA